MRLKPVHTIAVSDLVLIADGPAFRLSRISGLRYAADANTVLVNVNDQATHQYVELALAANSLLLCLEPGDTA